MSVSDEFQTSPVIVFFRRNTMKDTRKAPALDLVMLNILTKRYQTTLRRTSPSLFHESSPSLFPHPTPHPPLPLLWTLGLKVGDFSLKEDCQPVVLRCLKMTYSKQT